MVGASHWCPYRSSSQLQDWLLLRLRHPKLANVRYLIEFFWSWENALILAVCNVTAIQVKFVPPQVLPSSPLCLSRTDLGQKLTFCPPPAFKIVSGHFGRALPISLRDPMVFLIFASVHQHASCDVVWHTVRTKAPLCTLGGDIERDRISLLQAPLSSGLIPGHDHRKQQSYVLGPR